MEEVITEDINLIRKEVDQVNAKIDIWSRMITEALKKNGLSSKISATLQNLDNVYNVFVDYYSNILMRRAEFTDKVFFGIIGKLYELCVSIHKILIKHTKKFLDDFAVYKNKNLVIIYNDKLKDYREDVIINLKIIEKLEYSRRANSPYTKRLKLERGIDSDDDYSDAKSIKDLNKLFFGLRL